MNLSFQQNSARITEGLFQVSLVGEHTNTAALVPLVFAETKLHLLDINVVKHVRDVKRLNHVVQICYFHKRIWTLRISKIQVYAIFKANAQISFFIIEYGTLVIIVFLKYLLCGWVSVAVVAGTLAMRLPLICLLLVGSGSTPLNFLETRLLDQFVNYSNQSLAAFHRFALAIWFHSQVHLFQNVYRWLKTGIVFVYIRN